MVCGALCIEVYTEAQVVTGTHFVCCFILHSGETLAAKRKLQHRSRHLSGLGYCWVKGDDPVFELCSLWRVTP